MKIRNILLKTVPYLLSVAGGAVLFILSKDNIRDPALDSLVNNIAASLLSIPLVFLLYDYSNYRISRQVNKTLADGLNFKINSVMLELLVCMRRIVGARGKFTWGAAEKMFTASAQTLGRKLKITPHDMDALRALRDKLDDLAYHTDKNNVLGHDQIQMMGDVAHAITHLINERRFGGTVHGAARYAQIILGHMGDWFDAQDVKSLLKQQNFQIALGMDAPSTAG